MNQKKSYPGRVAFLFFLIYLYDCLLFLKNIADMKRAMIKHLAYMENIILASSIPLTISFNVLKLIRKLKVNKLKKQ